MAIFFLRGCMIPLGSRWDKRGSFGAHLYQKDPKSAKKWLSYGHFLTERLCDSIEKHMGQNGILWCLFVPKISKIGQEIAELGAFPPERLCESIEKHIIASYIIASCIIVSCIIALNIVASLQIIFPRGKRLGDSRTAKLRSGSQ